MNCFLFPFLLLYTSSALAQFDDNPNDLKAKTFELKVKTLPPAGLKLPFESIKIIDGRLDTSKLGYRFTGILTTRGNKAFKKIALWPEIQSGIENFYNEYYKNNFTVNGEVLLISIRKLWINSVTDRQGAYERKDIDRVSKQDIYAKFEYYLGSINAYMPLKRIDTIFQLTPNTKVEDYDPADEKKLPFFCFTLEKMVENVNYNLYINTTLSKKKMSVEEIEKYNKKLKDIPILNEPINKGVFITFNEFKNNRPSVTTFNKRKILKRRIFEIVDEKDNLISNYFAYYDGERLAIGKRLSSLLASNIPQDNYTIYKVNNSFQFFENNIQNTSRQANVGVRNDDVPIYIPETDILRVPRQIDMETGDIY